MYIPEQYKFDDVAELKTFIAANSFGVLVCPDDQLIRAAHIPLLLTKNKAGEDVLLGHISKANPLLNNPGSGCGVLAIFSGPHAYVSSSWYDHENVPTWNYIAVHVYGKVRITNGEEKFASLRLMMDKFESGSKQPVNIDALSQGFLTAHLKGIITFEIKIDTIEGVKKLSQNRDAKNRQAVVNQLRNSPDHLANEIAREMEKNKFENGRK